MARFPVGRDVAERVLSTFVLTVLTLASADGLDWTDWTDMGNWRAWAVAGLAAAFSLTKGLLASQVGKMRGRATSASLDPVVKLQPVTEVPPVT